MCTNEISWATYFGSGLIVSLIFTKRYKDKHQYTDPPVPVWLWFILLWVFWVGFLMMEALSGLILWARERLRRNGP